MWGAQLAVCSMHESPGASEWRMHLQVADMAYNQGLYSAALRNYQSALAMAQAQNLPEEDIVDALLGLAKCYCRLEHFTEAESLYKRVLQIDGKDISCGCGAMSMDLNELATLYLKTDRLSEAEQLLRRAAEILSKDGAKTISAEIEKNLASVFIRKGRLEEAERHISRALALCDSYSGHSTRLYPEILIVLASILTRKGSYSEAEPLIEEAISRFEILTGGEHPELAEFLDCAADLFRLENDPAKADEFRTRAASVRNHIRHIDR